MRTTRSGILTMLWPLILLSGTAHAAAQEEGGRRQRFAVVIGVAEYQSPEIADLRFADDDARAFHDFLLSPAAGLGGLPAENARLLIDEDATLRNIRQALTTFLRRSTPDDVIMIFIAGHGIMDPLRPSDLYILAHDTELDALPATALPVEDLTEALGDAYAYNKIVLMDALHPAVSMTARGDLLSNRLHDEIERSGQRQGSGGFVLFSAAAVGQLSQEGEQWGRGHGVFTHFLLEALRGAADEDGDGVVVLREMTEYVQDRVRRATLNAQIPQTSLTSYDDYWPMAVVRPPSP